MNERTKIRNDTGKDFSSIKIFEWLNEWVAQPMCRWLQESSSFHIYGIGCSYAVRSESLEMRQPKFNTAAMSQSRAIDRRQPQASKHIQNLLIHIKEQILKHCK